MPSRHLFVFFRIHARKLLRLCLTLAVSLGLYIVVIVDRRCLRPHWSRRIRCIQSFVKCILGRAFCSILNSWITIFFKSKLSKLLYVEENIFVSSMMLSLLPGSLCHGTLDSFVFGNSRNSLIREPRGSVGHSLVKNKWESL